VTTTVALADLKTLVGADLGASDWIEVTQQRINTFADATDDHQWIHVDVERAAAGPFGGPIAHGYLTLSLLIPLWGDLLRIEGVSRGVNYGLNRVRFPAPVPAGARIRLTGKLTSADDVPGGVQITAEVAIEIENGSKPACVAQPVLRYYA
jgi:acyl dehydratase